MPGPVTGLDSRSSVNGWASGAGLAYALKTEQRHQNYDTCLCIVYTVIRSLSHNKWFYSVAVSTWDFDNIKIMTSRIP